MKGGKGEARPGLLGGRFLLRPDIRSPILSIIIIIPNERERERGCEIKEQQRQPGSQAGRCLWVCLPGWGDFLFSLTRTTYFIVLYWGEKESLNQNCEVGVSESV